MRNSNWRRTTSNDGGWGIVIALVLGILAILSFEGFRALAKPNTRDYRPTAYDDPHSRRLMTDYVRALPPRRLRLALVFLCIVVIGAILLPLVPSGNPQPNEVAAVAIGMLVAFYARLEMSATAPRLTPFATVSLVVFGIVTVCAAYDTVAQDSLVKFILCCGIVASGIAMLQLGTLEGRAHEASEAWNNVALWALALVGLAILANTLPLYVAYGMVVLFMFWGAALFSEGKFDRDRFLVLVSGVLAFLGIAAFFVFPDVKIGYVMFFGGLLLLILATQLRRNRSIRTPLIAESLVTDPALVVPAEPTLTVLPAKGEYAPQTAIELIGKLLTLSDGLSLSILADGGEGITWQVAAPGDSALQTTIASNIESHYLKTVTFPTEAQSAPNAPTWRQLFLFGMVNDYAAPLPFAKHLIDHDPLAILCQRMSSLQDGERIRYQVTITTVTEEAKARAYRRLQQGKIHPLAALWKDPNNPLAGFDETLITTKLEYPLYHCFVSITIESRDKDRLYILGQAAHDIEQFYLPGHNKLILVSRTRAYEIVNAELAAQPDVLRLLGALKREHSTWWRDMLCVLSAPEIAALWHLPSEDFQADSIAWAHGRVPDALFDPTDGVPLGETTTPGMRSKTVYMKEPDRATHHYIAGKPKAGKSTLMLRLIQADIAAGHGVAVIDPHGTLVADVIRTSIPRERLDDVVLLEFRRRGYPVPINPFRIPKGATIAQASNYLMFTLHKIYSDIWLPGQTELYIQNVVQLLLTDKEATPLDIERVFKEDAYRNQLLEQLASGMEDSDDDTGVATLSLQQFWKYYDSKSEGWQTRILDPIINRTGALKRTELMELMTCHPHTLDFRQMIANKKIVLMDLSGDGIYQDVDNLATLLMSGFFLGAYSLGVVADARPRFYLYVDEIERTATAPLPHILSESRKYGLAAILANQYLAQIPEDTLNAILGTVGISTVFQVGIKDARFLAPQFEPEVTDVDLANLDLWRIAVKMRLDDKTLPSVILKTDVPVQTLGSVPIEELRAKAQQELLSRDQVRRWQAARYGRGVGKPTEVPAPPKNSTWMGTVSDVE